MKIKALFATTFALAAGMASTAAAATPSAADECIVAEIHSAGEVLRNIPISGPFTATVTYKGEELATLVSICEEKTGEKSVTYKNARELSLTIHP